MLKLKLFSEKKQNCDLPVMENAWDLPEGVYQVGVDKTSKGSKDCSCRVWMKQGVDDKIVIVAVEYYNFDKNESTDKGKTGQSI